jgi:hypothetical protein
MNKNETPYQNAIKSFYSFKNNLVSLYEDLQSEISNKLSTDIKRENRWNVSNFNKVNSDYILQYHFLYNDIVYGISILASIDPEQIKTSDYQHFATNLNFNPQIPLIIICGAFDPIDKDQYCATEWWRLCIGYEKWGEVIYPELIKYNQPINLPTSIDPGSYYWFTNSTYFITKLLEIKDQDGIVSLVQKLLSLKLYTSEHLEGPRLSSHKSIRKRKSI